MANRRAARIASGVQQEVARMLLTDVKDPRVGMISITEVQMNDDLSVAHIKYLPLGGKGDRKQIQEGLWQVAKHLRGPVGRALGTRHSPELRFEIDRNLEYSMHMADVLSNLPKGADSELDGSAAATITPAAGSTSGDSEE